MTIPGNAGDDEPDHRHHRLCRRGSDDSDHDPGDRPFGQRQHALAQIAGKRAAAGVQCLGIDVRVTEDEEDEEDHQHQLQQTLRQQRSGAQRQSAGRVYKLVQQIVHLFPAGDQFVPVSGGITADDRQPHQPGRRVGGQSLFHQRLEIAYRHLDTVGE
jgi:hypothetical protein